MGVIIERLPIGPAGSDGSWSNGSFEEPVLDNINTNNLGRPQRVGVRRVILRPGT